MVTYVFSLIGYIIAGFVAGLCLYASGCIIYYLILGEIVRRSDKRAGREIVNPFIHPDSR